MFSRQNLHLHFSTSIFFDYRIYLFFFFNITIFTVGFCNVYCKHCLSSMRDVILLNSHNTIATYSLPNKRVRIEWQQSVWLNQINQVSNVHRNLYIFISKWNNNETQYHVLFFVGHVDKWVFFYYIFLL